MSSECSEGEESRKWTDEGQKWREEGQNWGEKEEEEGQKFEDILNRLGTGRWTWMIFLLTSICE